MTKSYAYDAFGVEQDIDNTDTNPWRYCGEYFDRETGTIYLRARYYKPGTGRFTQQDDWEYGDTSDPLSLNLYVYCYGNPANYCDPSGNFPGVLTREKDGGGAVGGSWRTSGGKSLWAEVLGWLSGARTPIVAPSVPEIDAPATPEAERPKEKTPEVLQPDQSYEKAKNDGIPAPNHDTVTGRRLPKEGTPNSSKDLYDDTGRLKQRRYYGPDGKAQVDIDYSHPGDGHKFPHQHGFDHSLPQSRYPLPAIPAQNSTLAPVTTKPKPPSGGGKGGAVMIN